eukprot:CAMPEP_0184328392 /NCGR_PEP_ID=MMETSP1049-20130417/143597_1 /TAXON_ID=77928 /ORGANISM="Proteomonas sulcata, Strain CCMP704" /LENGTH=294 /DNA_ID=CAMNT_0026650699 /DNA_START=279 /DNA_END=1164 /DNA_ORIENTATION=+
MIATEPLSESLPNPEAPINKLLEPPVYHLPLSALSAATVWHWVVPPCSHVLHEPAIAVVERSSATVSIAAAAAAAIAATIPITATAAAPITATAAAVAAAAAAAAAVAAAAVAAAPGASAPTSTRPWGAALEALALGGKHVGSTLRALPVSVPGGWAPIAATPTSTAIPSSWWSSVSPIAPSASASACTRRLGSATLEALHLGGEAVGTASGALPVAVSPRRRFPESTSTSTPSATTAHPSRLGGATLETLPFGGKNVGSAARALPVPIPWWWSTPATTPIASTITAASATTIA